MKPSLFINASSFSSLKILGLGFPYCLRGVIVPTSTNPKPNLKIELYTSALLSNPAANPIGLGNFLLNKLISSIASFSTLKNDFGK